MDFQEPKTDMKQMNCYQKYLISKPLSNTYVFLRDLFLKYIIVTDFRLFCTKLVKTKHFTEAIAF